MNLRWLFGNFADPQYRLDPREQRALSDLAHRKYMPGRSFFWWTLLVLVLPVLAVFKFGLPLVLQWLGLGGRNLPYAAGVVVILVLFWIWAAWTYRRLYARPLRQAMRERGYDVCVGCGYLLHGLGSEVRQCPECGLERETGERG